VRCSSVRYSISNLNLRYISKSLGKSLTNYHSGIRLAIAHLSDLREIVSFFLPTDKKPLWRAKKTSISRRCVTCTVGKTVYRLDSSCGIADFTRLGAVNISLAPIFLAQNITYAFLIARHPTARWWDDIINNTLYYVCGRSQPISARCRKERERPHTRMYESLDAQLYISDSYSSEKWNDWLRSASTTVV